MLDPLRSRLSLSIRNRLLLQLGVVAFIISISLFLLVRQVIVQAVTATQDGLLNAAVQSIVDKITVIDNAVSLDLPYDTFSLLGAGNKRPKKAFLVLHILFLSSFPRR